jgi:hypothetical protein
MTLPERVCKTLEGLCMLEWTPKSQKLEDLVYKFCHIARGNCPHDNWMKQFEETEQIVNEALKAPGARMLAAPPFYFSQVLLSQ